MKSFNGASGVRPYLFMRKDGTDQALTAATWTEITGWNVTTLRGLDQAYSRVTIQQGGLYAVTVNIAFTPDTSRCLGAITLNAATADTPLARFDQTPSSSARVAASLSTCVECVPGDIIRGLVYVAATTRSVASGLSTMTVTKL